MPPVITLVIVTFRSKQELPACLESVLASNVSVKVVVIDNDSRDGTLELAQSYSARFPNVIAFSSGANLGLAAANNLVLPHLEGKYLGILNPDTVVEPDTLSTLIEELETRGDVGVVGPKCLYEDGRPHSSYHLAWGYWQLFVWRVLPYSVVRRLYDRFARYRDREVAFVSGACLIIRSETFKAIGGYDPTFFLTVEDACDLCDRVRQKGQVIRFVGSASIRHLCGRSGSQVPYLATLEGYKGSIYYFTKTRGRGGSWLSFAIVLMGCSVNIATSALKIILGNRTVGKNNLSVYSRLLVQLLKYGPNIAYSTDR